MDFTRDDITNRIGVKIPRGNKKFIPAVDFRDDEIEPGSDKSLSNSERDDERRRLVDVFPNMVHLVKDNIIDLRTLDQQREGACTVACLMHLIHASGKDHLHPLTGRGNRRKPMTWNQIKQKKYWNGIYKKILRGNVKEPGVILDHQEMFQVGLEQRIPVISNVVSDPSFRYVPILSRGYNERYLNPNVVSDASKWIDQIQDLIEGLIIRGIPVGIAQNGHARVIVGFNDTDIVMLDSWGDNWAQKRPKMYKYQDTFSAGFSTLPKYVIYGAVRDIIYFDTTLEQQMGQLNVSAGESKHSEPRKPTRMSTRRSTRRSRRNGLSTELGQPSYW